MFVPYNWTLYNRGLCKYTHGAVKKITQMDDLFYNLSTYCFASSKEKPKASLTLLTAVTFFLLLQAGVVLY